MSEHTVEGATDNPHPHKVAPKFDDTNVKPILQLWLLMTTNSKFPTQLLNDTNLQAQVAKDLKLTVANVKAFLKEIGNHPPVMQQVYASFQLVAHDAGYEGTDCPNDVSVITGM